MNSPNFHNTYIKLPTRFYSKSMPTPVRDPKLITANRQLASEIGIDPNWLESSHGLAMLSGNALPKGCDPIAQVYAGHQFGGWAPRLGDGRAHLIGQIRSSKNKCWDIQLKGSGITPYSRMGDGRAWLGPVLREYLISESMNKLGVPTTRALAFILTGETVYREKPLPGAILTRTAPSMIRIGTFEYFSAQKDILALSELLKYAIKIHYPDLNPKDACGFLEAVVNSQAELVSKWMNIGFIHGVMNTDNTHVGGLTIDYGPCAFMDSYSPSKVFSSIDINSRYSYSEQPKIIVWNLVRLAISLLPLIDPIQADAIKKAETILSKFDKTFRKNWDSLSLKKIGISNPKKDDKKLVEELLGIMATTNADFTQTFLQLNSLIVKSYRSKKMPILLDEWKKKWQTRIESEIRPHQTMLQTNPIFIPRNHLVEKAIETALMNDYSLFHRLLIVSETPFQYQEDHSDLYQVPKNEDLVKQTFCGT